MLQPLIQRLSRYYIGLTATGAAISMFLVSAIIFVNSLRRYTIGKSVVWGEEFPVFIAVYGLMFGAAYAYMQDRHIRFTILVGFLPERFTQKLYMLVDLLMIGVGGMLAFSGWRFVALRGGMETTGMISLARDLHRIINWDPILLLGNYGPYQFAMTAGGVLMATAALLKFFDRLTTGLSAGKEN